MNTSGTFAVFAIIRATSG